MPEIRVTLSCGRRIAASVSGEGPPLVFLHGWCMSRRVWGYQKGAFPRRQTILADLAGHGDSDPADSYSFGALAADVAEMLDILDLRRVVLVGWSLGAQVALQAAPLLRSRLEKLVLVGATPRFTSSEEWPHGLAPVEVQGMTLRVRRNYLRAMEDFFRGMFAAGEVDAAGYRSIAAAVTGNLPDPEVALALLGTLAAEDLRPLLPSLGLPVLLVHGEKDTVCLPGASRSMAEAITGSLLKLIPGAGHAPFLSAPADFNRLLNDFMGEA